MVRVTTIVVASLVAIHSVTAFAADTTLNMTTPMTNDALLKISRQHYMFDGVRLTEQQRQQMRDLTRQNQHDFFSITVADVSAVHKLVTAEKFDEAAVYAQVEKMAQVQVKRQVEIARIRNQMYNLLTPEQKRILDQKYQQQLQQQSSGFE